MTDVSRAPDLAKTLAWTERALGSRLPMGIATRLTPELLDFVRAGKFEDGVKAMRDKLVKYVKEETGFMELDPKLAEQMAVNALQGLAEHPEPIDLPPAIVTEAFAPADLPTPATFEEAYAPAMPPEAPEPYAPAPLPAELEEAEDVREQLRTVPIVADVPLGWDPIFALGCRQQTGQCE
jgi:hypothetical protein